MTSYSIFVSLIMFSTLFPIIGLVAMLFTLTFEKEIDILKNENKRVNLAKELHHSQYMQLNQQIQPHFLFNSMNLLLSLAQLNKREKLIETIEYLSKYLKFKYQVNEQLIPFQSELEYSKNYLLIQNIRFGQRLNVFMDIKGDKAMSVYIPPYMLQTLVENSFKHGLEKKVGPITLSIHFDHTEREAHLKVQDNGLGLNKVPFKLEQSKGHGLLNINKRLALLFEDNYQFKIYPGVNGGTIVEIIWPLILEKGEANERIDS